jgi:thiamine biosynthesis lipoprotein
MADALTKVMFVAGMQQALVLAQHWHVDVLLVDKAGRWQATPGLKLV